MQQVKLTFDTNNQRDALIIASALSELLVPPPDAHSMFEVGDLWRVDAYFSHTIEPAEIVAWLTATTDVGPVAFACQDIMPCNWVALSQAGLPPVRAGRFFIYGAHDRARVARGPTTFEIAAGEAFGTAHHATTQGCLLAIDRLTRSRQFTDVLDIGCGTGILALAASRALPKARVSATDIDPVAIDVAVANARLNGSAYRIAFSCEDAFDIGTHLTNYDLVIANILAGPLMRLAPNFKRALRVGAHIILSGILTSQVRHVLAAYRSAGFVIISNVELAGWATLILRRGGR